MKCVLMRRHRCACGYEAKKKCLSAEQTRQGDLLKGYMARGPAKRIFGEFMLHDSSLPYKLFSEVLMFPNTFGASRSSAGHFK